MKTKNLIAFLLLSLSLISVDKALAAPAAKSKTGSAPGIPDPGWPREITKNGNKFVFYQPQIDEWKDFRELKARSAFVLTPKDGKPIVGVATIEGQTTADVEARTVLIRDMNMTSVRFPSEPEAEAAAKEALVKMTFAAHSLTVSLDRLAAGVERGKGAAKPLELKMDPPKIFVTTRPSVLLMIEGKPVTAPIAGTKLEFVVNTNWDVFRDPATSTWYLLADNTWLTAAKPDGPWLLASELPADFSKLPKGDQWDHVKKAVPARVARGMTVPQVFYSEEPAELIAFEGNPIWQDVENAQLLWAKNTESWVFDDTQDRQIYFLVSGRWFSAPKWEGPWTYAGSKLPEDFKLIPPDSACADVLASVPGTPEAEDAVLLAQVPQEAVVKRKEAEAKAKVTYDGEPAFKVIEGTTMSFATNTGSDVILVAKEYYLCQDAVWFVAGAALGPWVISVTVPAVIYTIPPAYPVHRVTYVKVEVGATDDVVVCSYTAGYYGAFISGAATAAALVWGTGYYYPPFVAWGGPVPVYRPWPATYGCAAAYNPWTGGYAVGGRVYGPYASAGRAAWYNPATGNYGRAARVSGPYGSRTVAAGYNPHTDTGWATRQSNNGYAQWGSSAVRKGDDWVRAGHVVTRDGGAAAWHGSEGGGHVWKTDDHSGGTAHHDGNFYAGHDGNVYRRDNDGDWSKYHDGDWDSIDHKDKNRYGGTQNENLNKTPDRRPDGTNNGVRPGAANGGERNPEFGENRRPAQQDSNRNSFENRAPARRAAEQPGQDVTNRLSQESAGRERAEFNVQQHQNFQRSGNASFGSRNFGGQPRGGGLRRR